MYSVLSLTQTLPHSLSPTNTMCAFRCLFLSLWANSDLWVLFHPVITHNKVSANMQSAAKAVCTLSIINTHTHTYTAYTEHTGRQSAACALSTISKSTPVPAAVLKRIRGKRNVLLSVFLLAPHPSQQPPSSSSFDAFTFYLIISLDSYTVPLPFLFVLCLHAVYLFPNPISVFCCCLYIHEIVIQTTAMFFTLRSSSSQTQVA